MSDLISREAMLKAFDEFCGEFKGIRKVLEDVPAVDAVPVVHGEWMYKYDDLDSWYECSACGYCNFHYARNNYCPNCGAKMDRKEDAQ